MVASTPMHQYPLERDLQQIKLLILKKGKELAKGA
jgi:hypothetical protein